ncbi:hypothetical protein BC826DRAFT_967690 [Russula brevipes]|nr:hypothetical protein BC826DRAFT_967690 [Russula brevipes]
MYTTGLSPVQWRWRWHGLAHPSNDEQICPIRQQESAAILRGLAPPCYHFPPYLCTLPRSADAHMSSDLFIEFHRGTYEANEEMTARRLEWVLASHRREGGKNNASAFVRTRLKIDGTGCWGPAPHSLGPTGNFLRCHRPVADTSRRDKGQGRPLDTHLPWRVRAPVRISPIFEDPRSMINNQIQVGANRSRASTPKGAPSSKQKSKGEGANKWIGYNVAVCITKIHDEIGEQNIRGGNCGAICVTNFKAYPIGSCWRRRPRQLSMRQREVRVWGTNGGTCERYAAGGLMWQSGPGALRKGYPDWGPVSEEEHAMA